MVVDRVQLCEALGVSDSAIGKWEGEGLPVLQKGRGRGKKSLYNLEAALAWCAHNNRGAGMQALINRSALPAPAPRPSADVWTGGLGAAHLVSALALARLDWLKDAEAYRLLEELNESPLDACELADLVERFIDRLADRVERVDARAAQAVRAILFPTGGRFGSLEEAIAMALELARGAVARVS